MDNQETISTSHQPRLIVFASIGWGLFIATLAYGVLVYGPSKVQQGLIGAQNPASFSQTLPMLQTPPLSVVATRLVPGVILEIKQDSLIIRPDVESGIVDTAYEVTLTSATTYSQKTIQAVTDSDASTGQAEITEQVISRAQLSVGDRVELIVAEKEARMTAHTVTRLR